jgi:threonine aldolase
MRFADFRSDTLTKPTKEMRQVMMEAEVGDDVFGEDPTINRLQEMMAELTGKEVALFVVSGTQGNEVCVSALTEPGKEIIVGKESHIFNYECGGPALLSGVQMYPVNENNGVITLEQIQAAVRHEDVHYPQTNLICLENTHNRAGGVILPLENIQKISEFAKNNDLKIHLDGARLWNASVETRISLKEYCQYFDSVSLCFSKGLGAPVGSIVVGDKKLIHRVHYYRKVFGGGMRQAGILAAACIYAVENHFERLKEDHQRAKRFAEAISKIPVIKVDLETIQTNIVIFDVDIPGFVAEDFLAKLQENGVLMLEIDPNRIRAVTHLDLTDEDLEKAVEVLSNLLK